MLSRLERKIVDQARLMIPFCSAGRFRHVSFLVCRNKILSIGINSFKTNPLSAKFNFRQSSRHSELHAILNYRTVSMPIRFTTLFNVRIRLDGELGIAKPCNRCSDLIRAFDIKRVIYTTDQGDFQEWDWEN